MSGLKDEKYWQRIHGYLSENDIDARWILKSRDLEDQKAYGSLRIVSHPDLKPGYLRAYSEFVVSRSPKTKQELEKTVKDYKIDVLDLDYYSIDENIKTTTITHEDRKQVLEEHFGVKVFE